MPIEHLDVDENFRRIVISGRLDTAGSEQIENRFAVLAASAKRRVVVDLTAVTFLSSMGIRTLIANAKAQQNRGGRMVVHANGGHCAPVLAHVGAASMLPIAKGTVVGAIPGLRYVPVETTLDYDATLICFTDGITEAESGAGAHFTEDRLLLASAASTDRSVEDLLDAVHEEFTAFIEERSPADDCTLLAVRRPSPRREG